MGASIGPAIDYLISGTNVNTGTTLLADLTAIDSSVVLLDAVENKTSQSAVFIGKRAIDSADSMSGDDSLLVLGAGRVQEDYEIPCFIAANRPGPDMKPARDAALALFNGVMHWLAADRTLGGVLLQGRFAEVTAKSLIQDGAPDTGAIRVAIFPFSIRVRNHYIP